MYFYDFSQKHISLFYFACNPLDFSIFMSKRLTEHRLLDIIRLCYSPSASSAAERAATFSSASFSSVPLIPA